MLLLPTLLLSLLPTTLAIDTTTTTPSPPLHTATLHFLPPTPTSTPSTPHPLAILTYHPSHPHLSTLQSFTPPPSNTTSDPDALTSVLVYHHDDDDGPGPSNELKNKAYRSTVTTTSAFHAPYEGRFRVLLGAGGEVVGASWRACLSGRSAAGGKKGKGNGKGKGVGDFDILTTKAAPRVVFDKAAKGKGKGAVAGAGGGMAGAGMEGEEEVVEKTMLQKYWWVLLGVAVLAMAGTGDK